MRKVSLIAAAVAAAVTATSAFAVDFNGYARAGAAIGGDGAGDSAFEKNKVGRLGNEDDNYYEFGFSEELQTGEQSWKLESMIASSDKGQNGWEDSEINVAQFNVQAKGVIASDPEAVIWAGKRYYQRKDIHITDFYFLNTSGTGGGIENISLGDQKLSLAFVQDGENDQSSGYIFDARLANIGLWEDASLELATAYNFATEKDDQTEAADDGIMLTGIVHQNMDNGFNQTILQYGSAGYGDQIAGFGSGAWYNRGSDDKNDAQGYRIINWGVMNVGSSMELGHQLSYHNGSDLTDGEGDSDMFTAVVRPVYKWNDTMRTIGEVGFFDGENQGTDQGGHKFTLAQAWAMGDSFWSRPEIRFYGTYITDEEGDTFGDKGDSEFVTGVQLEAWW
ncbi:maltoporin LamB [Salinivibrio sp. ES.052]|jgi:Maltoporin (phage lambda and maltose receptor)|uniref:maltoporin LamB n=1 Tax=Salinivibrio sp. ES.052 TaxID=1882823 RepID=UPI00092AA813|nr:maltoporin LamB [Salinivibrio sp. ES.052]SIO32443.1 maltoporin [Salinivibrio sp. ES.052]